MMVATIGCNPRKILKQIKLVNAKQTLEPREKNSEATRESPRTDVFLSLKDPVILEEYAIIEGRTAKRWRIL
jgi:hypothetical protein